MISFLRIKAVEQGNTPTKRRVTTELGRGKVKRRVGGNSKDVHTSSYLALVAHSSAFFSSSPTCTVNSRLSTDLRGHKEASKGKICFQIKTRSRLIPGFALPPICYLSIYFSFTFPLTCLATCRLQKHNAYRQGMSRCDWRHVGRL